MVITLYLLTVFASVAQSAAAKLYGRRSQNATAFNLIKALTALVPFALMAIGGDLRHLPTLFWGLAYGVCQAASMYAGYRALCLGPMAPTSMLVSFSVVLPLLWGLTVGKEALTVLRAVGLVFLLLAMLLINADKLKARRQAERPPVAGGRYGLWILFVFVTFLCNGTASILQKQHQTCFPSAYTREFMLYAMLACAVIFLALSLGRHPIRSLKTAREKWFGVLAGLAMGLTNFLTLTLSGLENASVLFPMISAGTLLGALLCGRFLFKEGLKCNHYAALTLGIAAVVLLKL